MIRVRRDHPLLKGCRLLWTAAGPAQARNLVGAGPDGTATGTATTRCGPFPALKFDADNTHGVVWGNATTYGVRAVGVTVIARCRIDGDNSRTGQLQGIVSFKDAGGSDSTKGCDIYWIKDTFTNLGFNFALRTSGGYYYAHANTTGGAGGQGKDRVVAGVYDRETHGPRIYIDGVEATTLGSSGVGSPLSVAWDVASPSPVTFGRLAGEDYPFNGAVAWVAVFDRTLSRREIEEWSRDDRWPFLDDDSPLGLAGGASYATGVQVAGVVATQGGGVGYATTLDALVYLDGDLTGGGETAGLTAEYGTGVGVTTRVQEGLPELVSYATTVRASGVELAAPTVSYGTVVGVRSRPRARVDGRADLLHSHRYRR